MSLASTQSRRKAAGGVTSDDTATRNTSTRGLAELHRDTHQEIRIVYRDNRIIETTAKEIADEISGVRLREETETKLKKSLEIQYSALSARLRKWCHDNGEHLFFACQVPSKDYSEVHFFAVQNSNHYIEKFSRNLTRLEIEVEDSEKFSMISMKVLELAKMDEGAVQNFVSNYFSSF